MRTIPLIIGLLFTLLGCRETPKKQLAVVAKPAKKPQQNTSYPTNLAYLPADTIYPAYVLTTGSVSHEDEVDPKYANHNWMGLFKAGSSYYTATTKVSITRAYDAVLDGNEDDKTGWAVKPSVKDSAILLISGLDYIKPSPVAAFPLKKKMILPGDSLQFSYNGVNYTLHATGKNIATGSELYNVINYKLFIKATINGVPHDQELASVSYFNDAIVTVEFVGDIDGDGRPDLILDTTHHYNMQRPTLYLSKPAKGGKLLEVVGLHTYVGC